jgi:hypothetical protein
MSTEVYQSSMETIIPAMIVSNDEGRLLWIPETKTEASKRTRSSAEVGAPVTTPMPDHAAPMEIAQSSSSTRSAQPEFWHRTHILT